MLSAEDQLRLQHAEGYADLGMHEEANGELERISPEFRTHPDVLEVRLQVLLAAQRWPLAAEIARHLFTLQPGYPIRGIQLAYATRRAASLEAARKILLDVEKCFPANPTIQFNLGCYAAQLGKLDEAVAHVKRAIELDRSFQQLAIEDEDLKPIWEHLHSLHVP